MEQYCKGTIEDTQDIIDFADLVFSKQAVPHDFKSLVPKLYGDGAQTQQYHYLIKEYGKIRAMVCVLPVVLQVGEQQLKVACLGTVGVHPTARGKGYMKKLMAWALADMDKQGFDFSVLGGQRQRYEYFDYEPAGVLVQATLTEDNVRHGYRELDVGQMEFIPLHQQPDWVAAAYRLRQRQPVKGLYSLETFEKVLHTWDALPFAVIYEKRFVGYFCLSRSKETVLECCFTETACFDLFCKALMEKNPAKSVQFKFSILESEKLASLLKSCENYQVQMDHSYRIHQYARTIEAFLRLKASRTKLPEGRFSLEMQNGEGIELTVKDGLPTVRTLKENEKAALILSSKQATALLFSPLGRFWTLNEPQCLPDFVQQWFPLPMYLSPLEVC